MNGNVCKLKGCIIYLDESRLCQLKFSFRGSVHVKNMLRLDHMITVNASMGAVFVVFLRSGIY